MKEVSADELRGRLGTEEDLVVLTCESRTRWRKQPFPDRSTSHWDRSSTG